MAWNDDPLIRDLAEYGKKHGFDRCVVVGIDSEGGMKSATWGKSKRLCRELSPLCEIVLASVYNFYNDK